MPAFRFRAEAVLELRRAEEGRALATLTLAQGRFREARDQFDTAEARRVHARARTAALIAEGTDEVTLTWHRNWILGLASAVERERRQVERTAGDAAEATRAWQNARRRRLALERLRERAWQRHQRTELRLEQKAMDELARLRYAVPGPGGLSDGND